MLLQREASAQIYDSVRASGGEGARVSIIIATFGCFDSSRPNGRFDRNPSSASVSVSACAGRYPLEDHLLGERLPRFQDVKNLLLPLSRSLNIFTLLEATIRIFRRRLLSGRPPLSRETPGYGKIGDRRRSSSGKVANRASSGGRIHQPEGHATILMDRQPRQGGNFERGSDLAGHARGAGLHPELPAEARAQGSAAGRGDGEGGGDPDDGDESRVRPVRRGAGQGIR